MGKSQWEALVEQAIYDAVNVRSNQPVTDVEFVGRDGEWHRGSVDIARGRVSIARLAHVSWTDEDPGARNLVRVVRRVSLARLPEEAERAYEASINDLPHGQGYEVQVYEGGEWRDVSVVRGSMTRDEFDLIARAPVGNN